jgi:hypothetical protein
MMKLDILGVYRYSNTNLTANPRVPFEFEEGEGAALSGNLYSQQLYMEMASISPMNPIIYFQGEDDHIKFLSKLSSNQAPPMQAGILKEIVRILAHAFLNDGLCHGVCLRKWNISLHANTLHANTLHANKVKTQQ